MITTKKHHYYKLSIRPNLPGIIHSYNYSTGLCGLTEKVPLEGRSHYLGYMTEKEAEDRLSGEGQGDLRQKYGRRKYMR